MKYGTKRGIAAAAYFIGMIAAAFGLGYICGGDDCHEDEASRGRFEWGDNDEKPAIEWADGGEEEFYKALEEADKEEENESES